MTARVGSLLTSAAALMAVGTLSVPPVAPATTIEHRASQQSVRLAAVPSPLEFYPRVLRDAIGGANDVAEQYFADPFPILRVTLSNQVSAFLDAASALADGDLSAAAAAAIDVLVQPFTTVRAAASYLSDFFLESPFVLAAFASFAVGPLVNGLAATGKALWDIVEAAVTFDLVGVVNAVINVPGRIVDGVLNGGYVEVPYFGYLPGLFSTTNEVNMGPGILSLLTTLDQGIAAAIPVRESAVPEPVDDEVTTVESVPDDGADAVTALASVAEEPQESSTLDEGELTVGNDEGQNDVALSDEPAEDGDDGAGEDADASSANVESDVDEAVTTSEEQQTDSGSPAATTDVGASAEGNDSTDTD